MVAVDALNHVKEPLNNSARSAFSPFACRRPSLLPTLIGLCTLLLLFAAAHAQPADLEEAVAEVERLVDDDSREAVVIGEVLLESIPRQRYDLRMRLLQSLATGTRQIQSYDKARLYAQELLELAGEHGDATRQGDALRELGNVALYQGELEAAEQHYRDSLEIHSAIGNEIGEAQVLSNLGALYFNLGAYGEALVSLGRAVDLHTRQGDERGLLFNWINIGIIHKALGAPAEALEAYLEAARLSERIGDRRRLATVLGNIGLQYLELGEFDSARDALQKAYVIHVEFGDQGRVALALGNLASIDVHDRDFDAAIDKLRRAIEIAAEIGHTRTVAHNLRYLGVVYRMTHNMADSLASYREALHLLEEMGAAAEAALTAAGIGETLLAFDRPEQALEWLQRAERDLSAHDRRADLLSMLEHLARAHRALGEHDAALDAHERRWALHEAIEEERRLKRLETLQVQFDHEQQRREIRELTEERRIRELTLESQQLEIDKQRILRNSAVGGLVALLLLIGLMLRGYQIKTSAAKELRRQAATDPLTKLFNRRSMLVLCDKEVKRARRYGHDVSLWMIDIDYFKKINDRYGHQVGDDVLCAVAEILGQQLRESDTLARWGGEEFLALQPNTDITGSALGAGRVREALAKSVVGHSKEGDDLRVTISIGVASRGKRNISFEALLNEADQALYKAKNAGRNRVERF